MSEEEKESNPLYEVLIREITLRMKRADAVTCKISNYGENQYLIISKDWKELLRIAFKDGKFQITFVTGETCISGDLIKPLRLAASAAKYVDGLINLSQELESELIRNPFYADDGKMI